LVKTLNQLVRHLPIGRASAGCLIAAVGIGFARPAEAIVISGDAAGAAPLNDSAPLDDPGWDRVGMVGTNGTGVYLGNGFVLTAGHVNGKNRINIGGQQFNVMAGTTSRTLTNDNPGLTTNTDLFLFRVAVPENSILHGIKPIAIAPVSAAGTGATGTMIGTGHTQLDQTRQSFGGGRFGYNVGDETSREKRWATAEAGSAETYESFGNSVVGFRSTFNNTLNDGMANLSDSGSPWFWNGPAGSEFDAPALGGIVVQILTFENQPITQAVFGNVTRLVDLFEYRDQLQIVEGDLTGDGAVDNDDLALVLGRYGQSVTPGFYVRGDGTGDGLVNDNDLNLVLRNWTGSASPSFDLAAVPEPGTLGLLTLGGIALFRRRRA
jgi:hypothetical protein